MREDADGPPLQPGEGGPVSLSPPWHEEHPPHTHPTLLRLLEIAGHGAVAHGQFLAERPQTSGAGLQPPSFRLR